jgi:iron complex transport system substrate-binding protein
MRIVSLIASSTEIVCALGLRDSLVGRCHECDYPESVRDLPVCTAPKFKSFGSSAPIDERAILQESLSIYRVDPKLLNKLAPTHIITQPQWQVCDVSLKDIAEACQKLDSKPQLIALQPSRLADIYEDIKKVGTALGVDSVARNLLEQIWASVSEIRDRCNSLKDKPRVALLEWIDPLMPAANWLPELVELAGGTNLFGQAGQESGVIPWKEITTADPGVMIIAPSGFTTNQTIEEMYSLKERKGWEKLSCVQEKKVFIADGKHYFNRPGPRVLESLQILAEILHPDVFNFGHKDKLWMCFESTDEV